MLIPHIINRNTLINYDASEETKALLNEVNRTLFSENFQIFDNEDTLQCLCLKCIAKHFEEYPIINNLVLCANKDYLLEVLPTNLPLACAVPTIEDEIYWTRRFTDKYGVVYQHLHQGWTWKCIYLENYVQELIENAQPELKDEESMGDVIALVNPFVHRLVINQLKGWKPPLSWSVEDYPEIFPYDHINLEPIFKGLVNIAELELMFGVKNVGEKFTSSMFKVSLDDMRHMGKALLYLNKLKMFRLHNSNVSDDHIQILIKDLIKVSTLEELTISNCLVGDRGAMCIAKLIISHPSLNKLVLANNNIRGKGGEAIGFALLQNCCPLKHMNLRLNPLGHQGVMGIFRALVRVQKLEELIISGVEFEDETSLRLATVIVIHENLKLLDVSNNWLVPGAEKILDAVMSNSTLHWLDVRECDLPKEITDKINKKLLRNRRGETEIEEEEFEEEDFVEEEEICEVVQEESSEDEY